MRILLWHGYLLGGTGSNVYTRALAREWSQAGHEVVVVCQERAPEQFDLGTAHRRPPRAPGRAAAGVRARPLRGARARSCCRTSPTPRRPRYVEANAAALRELAAGRPRLHEPRAAGRPGRRRDRAAVPRQGARLRARVLDARPAASSRSGGARRSRTPRRPTSARRTSARSSRTSSAEIGRRARGAAGRRRRPVRARGRDQPRSRRCSTAARADPPNPGNANERLPDEGNAERLEEFLAGDAPTVVYFGKLIEKKGVQLLLEAMRDARRAARRRRLRPLPARSSRRWPPERTLFTGPLEHRHLVHLLPLADATVVPSIFPEAFGMVAAEAAAAGSPPARRAPLGPRRGRGGARGGVPGALPRASRRSTSGDGDDLARSSAAILALSAADHDELRRAARQAVVERWSWHSVAQRLLQPV